MNAAARHFLRDGFEHTSLDRIAATARVSKQSIYASFRDKDDLFEQVVRANLAQSTVPALSPDADVRATLVTAATALSEAFFVPRNLGLFRANILAMRRMPQLAAAMHDFRRQAGRWLADYLVQLGAKGTIECPAGSELDLATRLGGVTVEGTRYFLGQPPPSRRQRLVQSRLAADLFLHGLQAVPRGAAHRAASSPAVAGAPIDRSRLRMSDHRFDRLCAAAVDEFLSHGFDGASLGRIIAATGVARATLYRQFGSKEALFVHVIGREIGSSRAAIVVPRPGDLQQRLQALCRTALDQHLRPRTIELHRLLVQESLAFPELARAFYEAQVARIEQPLLRIVAEAGFAPPAAAAVRACHTLATFGVRYLVTSRAVPAREREFVSTQAARIIGSGVRRGSE